MNTAKQTKCLYDDFKQFGLPEILILCRNNNLKARKPYARHTHPGIIEFFYLVKGTQIMGACGRGYHLSSNDVFIAFPGEIHSSGIYPIGKSLFYWLQVDVSNRNNFMKLPAAEAEVLYDSLCRLPIRHFAGNDNLRRSLEKVINCYESPYNKISNLKIQHHLIDFFLEVISCAEKNVNISYSNKIHTVVDYITQHVDNYIETSDLVALAALSESRLRARFKTEVGIPLSEFMLKTKIEKATQLISTGKMTLTDIAFQLGFSSSQYFSTVFKRFTTMTPSEFKEKCETFKNISIISYSKK